MNKKTERIFAFACAYYEFMRAYMHNTASSKAVSVMQGHPHLGNEFKVIAVYCRHIICMGHVPDWVTRDYKQVILSWAQRVHNMPQKDIAAMCKSFFDEDNIIARNLLYKTLMCLKHIKDVGDL